MLTVIGTVPDDAFTPVHCPVVLQKRHIILDGRSVPVNRGTPALLAAAANTLRMLGKEPPLAWLAGDTGLGQGSRALYARIAESVDQDTSSTLVFHYLQPDVDWHNRVLFAIQKRVPRPILIADAGYMYAAKMSGQAEEYDLFTPDTGELAFLADETAPHPFYTRGFILQDENNTQAYIRRAYQHGNAARHLLIKGACDSIADSSGIRATLSEPSSPAMEAIGGTGDTLTGIVAGLIESGTDIVRASLIAAKTNRLAGKFCEPTPASQIPELIDHIPAALELALKEL